MSPLSHRVEEAGIRGVRRKRVPSDIVADDFFDDCDRVRALYARLISCPEPSRIAIVPSASYALATTARNTPVETSQNIVVAHEQFPSNLYTWRRLSAQTGSELRVVRPTVAFAEHWNEAFYTAIDRDTAIVALGPVHWTDGTRFDIEGIAARAHEVGAALIVDGTQTVGALPLDLEALCPDALICAAYKWLTGPYAIGVAYYGERYDGGVPLEEGWLTRVNSDDFQQLVNYQEDYRPGAARYDVGEVSNFALVPMLREGLEQLIEWGVKDIQSYCSELMRPLVDEALDRGWRTDEPGCAHIVGIGIGADTDLEALQAALRSARVAVSLRGNSIRISPHLYNDTDDITALISVLQATL